MASHRLPNSRILIDGALPSRLEIEPVVSIVSITRWTPTDPAEVIDAASYTLVVPRSIWCAIIAQRQGRTGPPHASHRKFCAHLHGRMGSLT